MPRFRKRFCFPVEAAAALLAVGAKLALAQSPLPPPPPAGAIEARLIAAFQGDQEALLRFHHREHVVSERDGVRSGRTVQVWYVNGRAITETIALDDRALTPAELETAHQAALQRAHDAALRPPAPSGMIEFAGRQYPFAKLADDYLYGNPRARLWQGRAIWVYQARPNPSVSARSREETLLLHSQGEVWVDAADLHIVRIALHTTSPVRYGLGVVATIHHATLELQMARQQPGLWLPQSTDFHLQATVLLLDSLSRGKQQAYSDYSPN